LTGPEATTKRFALPLQLMELRFITHLLVVKIEKEQQLFCKSAQNACVILDGSYNPIYAAGSDWLPGPHLHPNRMRQRCVPTNPSNPGLLGTPRKRCLLFCIR
jgi:hypothetical protein